MSILLSSPAVNPPVTATCSGGHRPVGRGAGMLLVLVLLLAGCSGDDGADEVRTIEDSGSAPGSGSASGSGSGSATAVADAPCQPVGEDLADEADETVTVTAVDYAFEPADLEVGAGTVTFEVSNEGGEPHELAFLPGGDEVPLTDDGAPDEEALADAGAFELEAFGPGQTCAATWELEPGDYTMFCIVETPDGVTHYEEGMAGTLTVS